jgi:cation transport regulator ChaB
MRDTTREHQYEKVLHALRAQYRALEQRIDALEAQQAARDLAYDAINVEYEEEEDDVVSDMLDRTFDPDTRTN